MICACVVDFYACAIPTSTKHSWNVFLFTCDIIYYGDLFTAENRLLFTTFAFFFIKVLFIISGVCP